MPRPRIRVGVTTTKLTSQGSAITVTGSATQWAPTDIAGLVAWYDFSRGSAVLFTDTTRTTPVSADGNSIKGVTDLSGNGYHLSEASAPPVYKPAAQNGRDVARFAANQFLSSTTPTQAQPITIISAVKIGGANQVHVSAQGDGNFSAFLNASKFHGLFALTGLAGSSDRSGAWHVLTELFNGASSQLWCDGSSEATGAGGAEHTVGIRLGANSAGSSGMTGDFGECLWYAAALSSTDRAAVEAYLKAKWGTP